MDFDPPKTLKELKQILKHGENTSLEFKRSTSELKEGLQSVCAFLNTSGGMVCFGINRKGIIEGQQVSEQTLHEITAAFERFEPPTSIQIQQISIVADRKVIILSAQADSETVPFTFEGRSFERIGNTTRKMSQHRYESLLLQRAHARRRWENQPAVDVQLKDLDRAEILRTRDLAVQQRRISAGTSRNTGDILDRLGLRRQGVITQAAQILYGKKFLPDYPQGLLKMGRFRGSDVTGEIVDSRQEHLNAFSIVREGMAFLDRTLPLGAKFTEGKIFREDRLILPPEALREVLLNAVMHRDYSNPGSYIAIAVFDDRVEIRSYGKLLSGITIDQLLGPHLSKLRNQLIAETFHRTGAVEIWGRGTNRIINECHRYGIAAPTFEEKQGFIVVTFRIPIVPGQPEPKVESRAESKVESRAESLKRQILEMIKERPLNKAEITMRLGRQKVSGYLNHHIRTLMDEGFIEYTLPEKPNSRLQKYKLKQS